MLEGSSSRRSNELHGCRMRLPLDIHALFSGQCNASLGLEGGVVREAASGRVLSIADSAANRRWLHSRHNELRKGNTEPINNPPRMLFSFAQLNHAAREQRHHCIASAFKCVPIHRVSVVSATNAGRLQGHPEHFPARGLQIRHPTALVPTKVATTLRPFFACCCDQVRTFVKNEDQNFSLFNYVNEQQKEIERLNEQLQALREEEKKLAQVRGVRSIFFKTEREQDFELWRQLVAIGDVCAPRAT